jgi:hypothetical protein
MSEQPGTAPGGRTLDGFLRDLCDHDLAELHGLSGAAHGLAEGLFLEARAAGAVEPAHDGLRFVLGEADAVVDALGERVQEALALGRAG